MNKWTTNLLTALILISASILVACGGGGGDKGGSTSSTPAPSSSSVISQSSVSSESSSEASQSSSTSSSGNEVQQGVFLDSPVANVAYRTETQSGVTDEHGSYDFLAGETVTFFLGDLEFPSVLASVVVTPLDMASSSDVLNPVVINITRLLQSLDVDGDPDNGIQISNAAPLIATPVNFDRSIEEFENDESVTSLIKNAGQDEPVENLVSVEDAVVHFETSLDSVPDYQPRVLGNVLPNPGFESQPGGASSIPLWHTNLANSATATFAVTSEEPRSGSRSLQIDVTNASSNSAHIALSSGTIAVRSSYYYTYGGWVKGEAGTAISISMRDATGHSYHEQKMPLNGEWQNFHYFLKSLPASSGLILSVKASYSENNASTIYLDDLYLVEAYAGLAVHNGGLEESTVGPSQIEGWAVGAFSGAVVDFTVTDIESHSGDKSLQVTLQSLGSGNAPPSAIYSAPLPIKAIPRGNYTVSGWVKGTPGAKAHVGALEPYSWAVLANDALVMTGDWQQFSFNITLGASVSMLTFQFDLNIEGNAGATLYLDDFSIVLNPTSGSSSSSSSSSSESSSSSAGGGLVDNMIVFAPGDGSFNSFVPHWGGDDIVLEATHAGLVISNWGRDANGGTYANVDGVSLTGARAEVIVTLTQEQVNMGIALQLFLQQDSDPWDGLYAWHDNLSLSAGDNTLVIHDADGIDNLSRVGVNVLYPENYDGPEIGTPIVVKSVVVVLSAD